MDIWTYSCNLRIPLFSKAITNGIRTYRHTKTPITKQHALDYLECMYPQALPYLNCNISDLCCEQLKKSPLKRVAKHMQMQCSIIGTLAEESQIRKRDWITYSSNISFQKKNNQCRPLSFGQTKTYGTTLNFAIFLFLIYIVKAIKEMAVCIMAFDCAQNDENLELTALNGWRRHTQSTMSIWYPAGHHFSRNMEFPVEIIFFIFIIVFFLYVKMDFQLCSPCQNRKRMIQLMCTFSTKGKTIAISPNFEVNTPTIYLNTFSNEGQKVFKAAQAVGCPSFTLVTISNLDWNHDTEHRRDSCFLSKQGDWYGIPTESGRSLQSCYGAYICKPLLASVRLSSRQAIFFV